MVLSRGASSSWQGGCPPIDEHQEWSPPVTQQHVILPNPGCKIEANMWHLDIKASALRPGPIASFLCNCNTMDSPPIPSYLRGGPQPAEDIVDLSRDASMANLRELYAERLQFEATCARLWANGIQDQIMDEQEKSRIGSQECLVSSIDYVESNLHGFINCKLKGISSLHCRWPHLQAHSRLKHHPVQHPMFQ